ncbi:uncharacterized protein LOC128127806 [Lactuca sativa]|uniref:uncharacterized protein LOC128127806 n=1 Tax=Lactuca sativa TaxID=4236 RepID=UPI0022B07E40|nr:uncharacterized protein LOC128127806 [Lactuca sativa]
MSKLEAQTQGKFPSQNEKNPKHNACVVTLISGKNYKGPVQQEDEEEEIVVEQESEATEEVQKNDGPAEAEVKITPPPFPSRLKNTKKEKEDKEIIDFFRKVEVNISLLHAIKQLPRYDKFLKELCTSKRKLKGNETVKVSENVSAVLQKRLPPMCKDPEVFTVPCKLGNLSVPRAMLDLGASINVLPYSLFKTIEVWPLKRTGVIIQLADRSLVHPKGVLEYVLVQVNELIFPADFYVLDIGDDDSPNLGSILLGRTFLKTARTKIDVYDGTLSMEFDGEVINFNIYDAMHYPDDVSTLNFIDVIEPLSAEYFEIANRESLALVLHRYLSINVAQVILENYVVDREVQEMAAHMDQQRKLRYGTQTLKLPISNSKLFPSVVKAPILELKTLPEHQKYAYLEKKETLPVIISNKLSEKEELELIRILKEYKSAIRWTIADITGLSLSLYMHKILIEEDYKPSREAQCRLNPPMMEVDKKEVMKLLDVGMIYPISDSKWVSPVQVVPKKAGLTVEENKE